MSQHPPGRGEARQSTRHHSRGSGPEPAEHETRNAYTGNTIHSLVMYRRRVKRGPLNGEAVRVMAGMVLDDLLRFSPTSQREAAIAAMALMRAEAVYRDAQRLASDVACLNALIVQEQEGAGA